MPSLNPDLYLELFKKLAAEGEFKHIEKLVLSNRDALKLFLGILKTVKRVTFEGKKATFNFVSCSSGALKIKFKAILLGFIRMDFQRFS